VAKGSFKRKLNLFDLFFLGIGSIIGSGWLYAAQNGASIAGPSSWISWIIGAVIIIFIGVVYSELGAALPRAGGFVQYPDYTHGSVVGYLIGFTSMIAYSAVIGIEAEAVRGYAAYWWEGLNHSDGSPTALGIGVQIALIILFFFLNYWSVNFLGKLNTVLTIYKFIVPLLIVIFLLANIDFSNFSVTQAKPGGIKGIFEAVTGAGIVFAFNGFRQPIEFAAESRRPQRDVPLAIILSVLVGLVIYLLLQFSFIGAVPHHMLSGGWSNVSFDSPWVGLAGILGLHWLALLVLLDSVVSPTATGNIYFSASSRSIYAYAKNGYFYKMFRRVDPKTGLPRAALWLTLLIAIAWTLPSQFQVWHGLVSASTSAKAMTFMVGPVSMMVLRNQRPNMERPFKLRFAQIIAPIAYIASTLVIYWSEWKVVSILIPIIIPSLVLYFAFVTDNPRFEGKVKRDFKSSFWLFGYYVFLFVFSYIGSYGPGKWIPAPWDTIVVALGSLVFFYWAVATPLPEPEIEEEDS
jgi:amino acid transporter